MKTLTMLITFLMAACGGGVSSDSVSSDGYEAVPKMEVAEEADLSSGTLHKTSNLASQTPREIEKKVIKTGGLSYAVESTKDEYTRLTTLLKQYDGYIASENESKGYDRINFNVKIKVPPQNFDILIADITKDKKVENRWVNASDVTDRFYDLQSRITNKKKLEARYQEILKKANNVRDILEVERNLNQVRGEIESLQGQFKLLNHQIAYSTLDISFYELVPYELNQEPRPGFGTRLLNSFSAGWQGFLTFLVYVLTLWPFGILAAGIVWLVKKVRARRKKSK